MRSSYAHHTKSIITASLICALATALAFASPSSKAMYHNPLLIDEEPEFFLRLVAQTHAIERRFACSFQAIEEQVNGIRRQSHDFSMPQQT